MMWPVLVLSKQAMPQENVLSLTKLVCRIGSVHVSSHVRSLEPIQAADLHAGQNAASGD